MPINATHQGVSAETRIKEAQLAQILPTHHAFSLRMLRKHSRRVLPVYRHVDLNAGTGAMDVAGDRLDGSALVFIQSAETIALPYCAHFIEIEGDACRLLRERVDEYREWRSRPFDDICAWDEHASCLHVENEDNRDFLKGLIANPGHGQPCYGLVYSDPNGITDIPFDLLAAFSRVRQYRMVDILMYVQATSIKRARGAFGWPSLREHLASMQKDYWIVREPRGPFQWTFILGTNWDKMAGKFRRDLDFHAVDSPRGRGIFDRLNLSKKEVAPCDLFAPRF